MYKHLQTKFLALLAIMLMGGSSAWAETTTVTASRITSTTASWTGTAHETWAVAVDGGAVNQSVTSGYAQVGTSKSPSNSITFSTSGISGTITSIVVDCASYQGKATLSATVGGNDFGTQGQQTPSWSNNAGGEVTFSGNASGDVVITMTNGTDGRAMYIKSISVTYAAGNNPSISVNNNNIHVSADETEGTINVTYTNFSEVVADVEFYDADGTTTVNPDTYDWVTAEIDDSNNLYYLIAANEGEARTAYMKVYALDDDNEVYSELITITQAAAPVAYTTIPALFEAATSEETDVNVTFNNWVVSGVSTNGKNVFVTDNNGNGFVIYSSEDVSSTYSAGNILSGTAVPCKLKKYNGFAELINVNAENLIITEGGTVAVSNIAMADLSGVNTGALVSYEGLECSVNNNKYYLSDGTTTIQVYNALYAFEALVAGKQYNITGIYQQYNSTQEILPRSAEDIEEIVIPTITLDPSTINVDAEEHNGTITISLENLTVEDKAEFGVQYYNGNEPVEEIDWITVEVAEQDPQVGEGFVVSYTVAANEGPARTATFKVYVEGGEDPFYSNLVTITQAAYAAPVEGATFTLAHSVTPGKEYIIVSEVVDGEAHAMGAQNDNNRAAVKVNVDNNNIEVTSSDVRAFVIEADGDNYTIYDAVEGGYLYAASSSKNHLKTETELDENGNATWSIEIDEEGVATIKAQGTNTRNWMRFNSSSNLFSCYASGQQPVYLYEKVEATPTQTVSITAAGMATFCSENALDFTGLTDMYAYIAQYNDGKVTYRKVTKVPARTGVLLRNPNGGATSQEVPVLTGAADDVEGNKFIGTLTDINELASVDGTNTNYILNKGANGVGFYKANGQKVGAGKAYLQLPTEGAKTFIGFEEEGEATSISTIDNGQLTMGNAYNLQGQKVGSEYKGIVIVNGKKIMVK